MQSIRHQTLDNGLHIITESISNVRTAAIEWTVPAGVATNEFDGDSVLLAELLYRGAGGMSAREHTEKMDNLGLRRDISCGVRLFKFQGLMLGSRAVEAIEPIADMVLRPALPSEGLEASRQLCLQSLDSIEDNPSRLVSVTLNKLHYPPPFNRSTYGECKNIESATIDRLKNVHDNSFRPAGSIVSVAGDVEHDAICFEVQKHTEGWNGSACEPNETSAPVRGVHFIEQDSSQVHIGLAFDAPQAEDSNSLLEKIAISIFGGATSGRLFTEVRQKRSLCYSVHAAYRIARDHSSVRVHAGTTPQRATETIEVILDQLELLRNGVSKEELARAVTRLRAGTVMQGESTVARAGALLGDQFTLGDTRTLQQRLDELSTVTLDGVNAYLQKRVFGVMTLVVLGPNGTVVDEHRVSGNN